MIEGEKGEVGFLRSNATIRGVGTLQTRYAATDKILMRYSTAL